MKRDKADPHTKTIMLTGRRSPAAAHVRNVLRNNNLYGKRIIDPKLPDEHDRFKKQLHSGDDQLHPNELRSDAHEEYYTGDHVVTNGIPGTFGHKRHVIDSIVYGNKGFETIEIWDDRKDHIEIFKSVAEEYFRKGLVTNFIIHQVFPPKVPGAEGTVIHIPIKH